MLTDTKQCTYRKSPKGHCYYIIDQMQRVTAFGIITFMGKYQLIVERWVDIMDSQTYDEFIQSTSDVTEDAFQRFLAQYIKNHEEVMDAVLPDFKNHF